MKRNDPLAQALIGLCSAMSADPRQQRPRPRLTLGAFADALLQRDTTPREDLDVLQHIEDGLSLAFRFRAPMYRPLPESGMSKPAPKPPAPPAKRSHHKKPPGSLPAAPRPKAPTKSLPWPWKKPYRPEGAADVPRT